jgi:uncharacterized membrane protein
MSRGARALAVAAATLASLVTLLALDLTWLGLVARSLYDEALGPLKRPTVFAPAAALFYVFYLAVVVGFAVLGTRGPAAAARRGALVGLIAYGTYELTNWAVLKDWPAVLVPVDIAWGVLLTAAVAGAGSLAWTRLNARGGSLP